MLEVWQEAMHGACGRAGEASRVSRSAVSASPARAIHSVDECRERRPPLVFHDSVNRVCVEAAIEFRSLIGGNRKCALPVGQDPKSIKKPA
jgi:hypothetical protein